jgi:hypothetical protein
MIASASLVATRGFLAVAAMRGPFSGGRPTVVGPLDGGGSAAGAHACHIRPSLEFGPEWPMCMLMRYCEGGLVSPWLFRVGTNGIRADLRGHRRVRVSGTDMGFIAV